MNPPPKKPRPQDCRRDAKRAVARHWLNGDPMPKNPWGRGTRRHFYWQWGADHALRLIAQLED